MEDFDTKDPESFTGGLIVNLGAEEESIERLIQEVQKDHLRGDLKEVSIAGATFYELTDASPRLTWGVRGKYLIIGIGEESAEGIFQRARTPVPAWLTELRANSPERRTSLSYCNMTKLVKISAKEIDPETEKIFIQLGLRDIQSFSSISSLQEGRLVTQSLLKISENPQGLVKAMLEMEPISPQQLQGISENTDVAFAVKMNAGKALEWLAGIDGIG